jgi:hypothetical protein
VTTSNYLKRLLPALAVASAVASAALAVPSSAPQAAKSTPADVSYSGCLERVSRNHDAFVLANVTKAVPGQPARGYDVLSSETLRLEPQTPGALDFSTWEGQVVVATGTIVPNAPRPKDPVFQTAWGKRFAGLPLLKVTAYKHMDGTLPCPA